MTDFVKYKPISLYLELLQQPDVEGPKPIVQRLDGNSFYELISSGREMPWEKVTHVLVDGLRMDHEGWLAIGIPNLMDFETEQSMKEGVLRNPKTFAAYMFEVQKKYPHLKWIWQVPRTGLNELLKERMDNAPLHLLGSMEQLQDLQQVPIDGFALSFGYFDIAHRYAGVWADFVKTRLTMWCTIEHEQFGEPIDGGVWELRRHAGELLQALTHLPAMQYFLMPSFGFMKSHKLITNRGTSHWLQVGPDAGLYEFKYRLNSTWMTMPRDKILMEIDTLGVQFTRDSVLPNKASSYSLKPFSDIHRLEKLVELSSVQGRVIDNELEEYSCLVYDDFYISYDNQRMRRRKLDFVKKKLRGVVLGDIVDDLGSNDPRSLLNMAVTILGV